jgi:hypothetical protein
MFVCAMIVFINCTNIEWNQHDFNTVQAARQQCPIKFENSPCVSKFIKYRERGYGIVCGPAKERSENVDNGILSEEITTERRTKELAFCPRKTME